MPGVSPSPHPSPQTPALPQNVQPSQPTQAQQPQTSVFGLKIPVNDWEAALILYALGLFMVETTVFGDVYLLGAWASAFILFAGTLKQQQNGG